MTKDKQAFDGLLIKIRALMTRGNLSSIFIRDMSIEMLSILIYNITDDKVKALEQLYSIYADIEKRKIEEAEKKEKAKLLKPYCENCKRSVKKRGYLICGVLAQKDRVAKTDYCTRFEPDEEKV